VIQELQAARWWPGLASRPALVGSLAPPQLSLGAALWALVQQSAQALCL